MVVDRWSGKDLEVTSSDLIQALSRNLLGCTEKIHERISVRIVAIPTVSWTKHVPNKSVNCYNYKNLLGFSLIIQNVIYLALPAKIALSKKFIEVIRFGVLWNVTVGMFTDSLISWIICCLCTVWEYCDMKDESLNMRPRKDILC
jgi:hypothetical protein